MKLTQRELEVLKLLCLSDKDIAKRLIISIRTVKCHVHNILNKLTCSNRAEAIAKAIKKEIIQAQEVYINE